MCPTAGRGGLPFRMPAVPCHMQRQPLSPLLGFPCVPLLQVMAHFWSDSGWWLRFLCQLAPATRSGSPRPCPGACRRPRPGARRRALWRAGPRPPAHLPGSCPRPRPGDCPRRVRRPRPRTLPLPRRPAPAPAPLPSAAAAPAPAPLAYFGFPAPAPAPLAFFGFPAPAPAPSAHPIPAVPAPTLGPRTYHVVLQLSW